MNINTRIKEAREKAGMTWAELGRACGVSWQSVRMWEQKDGSAPTRKRLPKVAAALNVSVEWLLTGNSAADSKNLSEKFAFIPFYGQELTGEIDLGQFVEIKRYDGDPNNPDSRLYGVAELKRKKLHPEHLAWSPMPDDAMAPAIPVDSELLIDLSSQQVVNGSIYLIAAGGRVHVRRLATKLDGRIEVYGDNPTYPNDVIDLDKLNIIGRVVKASVSLI